MHFNRTTIQVLTCDIYKICDGEQTKVIIGEYSPDSKRQPKDIFKTVIEVKSQK